MSGICGIFRFGGRSIDAFEVEQQLDALAHRGPDRRSSWHDRSIGLGNLLLRVTPEDDYDKQPLHDVESGLVLSADVRLDNRAELASQLSLDNVSGLADSTLLLRAWRRWGENCTSYLLGDFVFALWDSRNRRLHLVRDHMGQRQLFYHIGRNLIAFATEIKGLWALPEVPQILSEKALGRTLTLQIAAPRDDSTFWKDIRGLQPGRILSVDATGNVSTTRYWEPAPARNWEHRSEDDFIEGYREVLGKAVSCRLRSTGGIGLMFSGGFDSGAIAAFATRELASSGRSLVAISSVMPESYRGSIRHCRKWVEICRRDMPSLEVRYVTREGRSPLDGIEQSIGVKDGPPRNYDFVNAEILDTATQDGIRVIMDGHGGDYTLNPRGNAFLAWLVGQGELSRFAREFFAHRRTTAQSYWKIIREEVVKPLLPYRILDLASRLRHGNTPAWRELPIANQFAEQLRARGDLDDARLYLPPSPREAVRKILQVVSNTASTSLGNETAARHMDLTRPFHDRRVVEFALAVPENLYVRDGYNRYLARVAMKDLYPPEFATRWRRNDDLAPDFHRCVKELESVINLQLNRLAFDSAVPRYIDVKRIRELLASRDIDDHNSGWEQETQLAVMGLLTARFVEWFKDRIAHDEASGGGVT